MKAILKNLIHDDRGTSAIEMGLICVLIVLAAMTAMQNFGNQSSITWSSISSKTEAAVSGATAS